MMLNYCSDTLSLRNRIDFPRTFRIKKKATYRLEYIAFVFSFSPPVCYPTTNFFVALPSMMV